jgi:hypothetical protein
MIVQSVVFNSAPLSGPWAVIKLSGGTLIASSYTPFSIIATGGAAYTVSMSDYGCFVFSHWGDGSTNPTTTVTLTQATTLTAYYTTDFNCALWAYLYPIS